VENAGTAKAASRIAKEPRNDLSMTKTPERHVEIQS
jgi:hypothetical protein